MDKKKIEVLVAAVNQDGEKLYREMKISCDAIIANQTNRNNYTEITIDGKRVKIVETDTKGVGKNRNIGLLYSTAEILLFSDEDIIYYSNYEEEIVKGFSRHPDADILIFDLNYLNLVNKKEAKKIKKEKRVNRFQCMRFGTPRFAVKRESILKANIWFSLLYGGGAPYSSGEDSLFLIEALNKGLKIYTMPVDIADVKQEKSSWFNGYTDKFYIDKGRWIANAFPYMKHLLAIYYTWKFSIIDGGKEKNEIYRLIRNGYENKKGI